MLTTIVEYVEPADCFVCERAGETIEVDATVIGEIFACFPELLDQPQMLIGKQFGTARDLLGA